jgi:hypothetical protein
MSKEPNHAPNTQAINSTAVQTEETQQQHPTGWRIFLSSRKPADEGSSVDSGEEYKDEAPTEKWSLGILNDKQTEEVPGECIVHHPICRVHSTYSLQARFSFFLLTEMNHLVFAINPKGYLHLPCHLLFLLCRGKLPYVWLQLKRRKRRMDKYCSILNPMTLSMIH